MESPRASNSGKQSQEPPSFSNVVNISTQKNEVVPTEINTSFKPFDKESMVINTADQIGENDEDRELDMAQSPGLKMADDAIKEL